MANLIKIATSMMSFKEPDTIEKFILKEKENEEQRTGKQKREDDEELEIADASSFLNENIEFMKRVYCIPTSGDVILREFDIAVKDNVFAAFILFIDGMVDRAVINEFILQPLMLLSNMEIKNKEEGLTDYIKDHIMPHNQIVTTNKMKEIIRLVNFGGCAVFIDGLDTVFVADVKGWEHRGVERPNNELVLRGPQEGFNELLRANTALVRKFLLDENLIVENMTVGKRSRTPCSVLYIRDIANDSLVREVKRRMVDIRVDYVISSGELEQFIEDSTVIPTPQIITTERPDKVASLLSEGKVAVMVNGSPFALVMPATVAGLFQSPEDSYARFPYGNFMRLIRLLGVFLAMLLPGLYVAVTNYHHEMLPTDLMLSIVSAREMVPFPSVVEIAIMEVAFELIREAGVRIPGPIGPTLGIIGALILGQAAVAANIVSPILIIIVAVTGIGNFTIPDYSFSFAVRMLRFAYIVMGALAGLLGITVTLFMHLLWLTGSKSFGVPIFTPMGPLTSKMFADEFTRGPIWKQERRPDFLNTKSDDKQEKISRGWTEGGKGDEADGENSKDR